MEKASVAVRVMHTDEEVMIAKSFCRVEKIPMERNTNMVSKTQTPKHRDKPDSADLLHKMDAYWRAANYLVTVRKR